MSYIIKDWTIQDVVYVLEDARDWLKQKWEPLWDKAEITRDALLEKYPKSEIYICYDSHKKQIWSLILQYEDATFWPEIPYWKSWFIHKLAVTKEYHWKWIASLLVGFAEEKCRKK